MTAALIPWKRSSRRCELARASAYDTRNIGRSSPPCNTIGSLPSPLRPPSTLPFRPTLSMLHVKKKGTCGPGWSTGREAQASGQLGGPASRGAACYK
eukprot:1185358-Prorocentrum_minimum.AAC.1